MCGACVSLRFKDDISIRQHSTGVLLARTMSWPAAHRGQPVARSITIPSCLPLHFTSINVDVTGRAEMTELRASTGAGKQADLDATS